MGDPRANCDTVLEQQLPELFGTLAQLVTLASGSESSAHFLLI
jgi:hypothetical protein